MWEDSGDWKWRESTKRASGDWSKNVKRLEETVKEITQKMQ